MTCSWRDLSGPPRSCHGIDVLRHRSSLSPRRRARASMHGVPGQRFKAIALGAWVALAIFETNARGAAQTFVALEYDVPADAGDCPDVDEFRAGVAGQLHYDPFR